MAGGGRPGQLGAVAGLGRVALQVDRAASPVLDLVGGWSIEAARDASWLSATVQWTLQGREDAYAAYLGSRESLVGLVTRQLLTPVPAPERGPAPGSGG